VDGFSSGRRGCGRSGIYIIFEASLGVLARISHRAVGTSLTTAIFGTPGRGVGRVLVSENPIVVYIVQRGDGNMCQIPEIPYVNLRKRHETISSNEFFPHIVPQHHAFYDCMNPGGLFDDSGRLDKLDHSTCSRRPGCSVASSVEISPPSAAIATSTKAAVLPQWVTTLSEASTSLTAKRSQK